ncbi:hypothetical protein D3C85_1921320 [compost metagenome]
MFKSKKEYLDRIEKTINKHPEIVPLVANYYAGRRKPKRFDTEIDALLKKVEMDNKTILSGKEESAATTNSY